MKNYLFLLLGLLVVQPVFAEGIIKNTVSVKLEFRDPRSSQINDTDFWSSLEDTLDIGLLYSTQLRRHSNGDKVHFGSLTVLGKPGSKECFLPKSERCVLAAAPVLFTIQTVGLVASLGWNYNGSITLTNVDGKTYEDLLGPYYGGTLGFGLGVGGKTMTAVNDSGVILGDVSFQGAVSIHVGATVVTIEPYDWDRYSWDNHKDLVIEKVGSKE